MIHKYKVGEFGSDDKFVLLRDSDGYYYITGDETSWEPLKLLEEFIDNDLVKMSTVHMRDFWMNSKEVKELRKAIESYRLESSGG